MKKLGSILLSALTLFILVSCTEDEPQIKITSITFNTATVQVVEGTSVDLNDYIVVEGEDADQAQITFASDNEEVVSVSGTTLTAAGVGNAKVEATETNTSQNATIAVTVLPKEIAVTGVTLDKETADLKVGETLQLTATVAPEDATEKGLTWSVAFPPESKTNEVQPTDIATISETGLITAISAGSVVATATTKDGEFTASTDLSITNVTVTGVTLDMQNLSVNVGESGQLTATISPENATNKNVTWTLTLADEGDPETYATINPDTGGVTGVSECDACGLAVVATTEDGGFTVAADLFVVYIPVTNITLNPGSFTVKVGETQQMTATISPENASNKSITWTIDVSSDNCRILAAAPTYASVDENGLVSGVSSPNGCYDITVVATSADGPSQSVGFDVIQLATSITITDSNGIAIPGKSLSIPYYDPDFQLAVSVLPANTSDKSVTWSIEGDGAVEVDQNGYISGMSAGTDRITVTTNDGSGLSDYVDVTFEEL